MERLFEEEWRFLVIVSINLLVYELIILEVNILVLVRFLDECSFG